MRESVSPLTGSLTLFEVVGNFPQNWQSCEAIESSRGELATHNKEHPNTKQYSVHNLLLLNMIWGRRFLFIRRDKERERQKDYVAKCLNINSTRFKFRL